MPPPADCQMPLPLVAGVADEAAEADIQRAAQVGDGAAQAGRRTQGLGGPVVDEVGALDGGRAAADVQTAAGVGWSHAARLPEIVELVMVELVRAP